MSEHSFESDTDASAPSKRRGVSNADDKPVPVPGAQRDDANTTAASTAVTSSSAAVSSANIHVVSTPRMLAFVLFGCHFFFFSLHPFPRRQWQ
jgi:hypothetical protein